MADEYAWRDRDTIYKIAEGFQRCLDDFMMLAEKTEKFKLGVLEHPARLAELKKIIDEDPNWTIQLIRDKYNEIKTVYNFIMTLREG